MAQQDNKSFSDLVLEQRKLRKEVLKNQSKVIRSYGHLLNKALDNKNIHAEVQEIRDDLYKFADKLKQMAEKI